MAAFGFNKLHSMLCAMFLKIVLSADKGYADKPEVIDALKDNIREAIGEIWLHTIDNMLKNWTNHVGYCMASRGSHLN